MYIIHLIYFIYFIYSFKNKYITCIYIFTYSINKYTLLPDKNIYFPSTILIMTRESALINKSEDRASD